MRRHKAGTRALATALALVTGLTIAAAPAAAAEVTATATKAPAAVKPSLSAAALKAAEAAPSTALAQAAEPARAESGGGFLRTTKGKVAVALFAGALAWTIYSNSDGREPVKSPVR